MKDFTIRWVVETLNAPIIADSAVALHGVVTGVSIDTRTIRPGDLFFALRGEHSDGHEYVKTAFERGAIAAVVSDTVADAGGRQIRVPDTLRAFGDLAAAYRRQFPIPIVGVTGSVGKTSTKEMIAAVLRTRYNTLANEKNFNNEIGVPLTLFQLDRTHEVAVIEMGMRGLGEIDRLAEIAAPTIGLITNIGYAHVERLGNQANIAQAKTELFQRLPQDGIALIPLNPTANHYGGVTATENPYQYRLLPHVKPDALSAYLRERVPVGCRIIVYGPPGSAGGGTSDVILTGVADRDDGGLDALAIAGEEEAEFTLFAVGHHHIRNAAAALAVGYALNVPLELATTALEKWRGAVNRMAIEHTSEGLTVLNDCYNASLESMQSALTTLHHMTVKGKRVAILGDMKELGEFSLQAHQEIGRAVVEAEVETLVTVGGLAKEIAATAQEFAAIKARHFADSDEAAAQIRKFVEPGDTILVKGSRAMRMEKIVAVLMSENNKEEFVIFSLGEKDGDTHA